MNKIFKNFNFIILVFTTAFFLNSFVYAQTTNKKEVMTEMVEKWAEAWKTRDGKPRYDMMSEKMKKDFEEKQGKTDEGNLIYSIRWSSPWVESYTVDVDEENENAEICYIMKTSHNDYYVMWDYIAFGFNKPKNKMEVIACASTDLSNYDKLHECVSENFPHSVSCSWGPVYENYSLYKQLNKFYIKLEEAIAAMISTEFICDGRIISCVDIEQMNLDNTGKIITVDANITAMTEILPPVNPAKDENLKSLKSENIDDYIKFFSDYDLTSTQDINYTLKAKIDLETNGIVSIELQHKDD